MESVLSLHRIRQHEVNSSWLFIIRNFDFGSYIKQLKFERTKISVFKISFSVQHKHRQRQNQGYFTAIQQPLEYQPVEPISLKVVAPIVHVYRPQSSRITERRIRRQFLRGDFNVGYAQIVLSPAGFWKITMLEGKYENLNIIHFILHISFSWSHFETL